MVPWCSIQVVRPHPIRDGAPKAPWVESGGFNGPPSPKPSKGGQQEVFMYREGV